MLKTGESQQSTATPVYESMLDTWPREEKKLGDIATFIVDYVQETK